MAPSNVCAISVDLDPLTSYYEIHGLGAPPRHLQATIMAKVLPRFEELFDEAGVRSSLFVVGRELEKNEEGRAIVARLANAGHELCNHTYSHPYDLCRQPEQVIEQEIRKAHDVIVEHIGPEHAPVGFRSPGYFINSKVLGVLTRRGYRYDSSMFPSPPYYFAKAAVMAGMTLRGRESASVISDPRGLRAPIDPYRPHPKRPWARGDAPLVELPIAVLSGSRIPAIGTIFAAGPDWLKRHVLSQMRGRAFFNFELHGIDLADAVDDCIPTELAGRQPDLRIPFVEKRRIFLETIDTLKRDFEFVTLAQAAERFDG